MDQRPKNESCNLKLLEENIREKLHYIGFGNDLLDITLQAQQLKKNKDRVDYIKI